MPFGVGVVTGVVIGHTGVQLLARVVGANGQPITRATLSAIAYAATDLTAGISLGTGTFTVSTSVFDTLQQGDPRWVKDSPALPGPDGLSGYNFLAVLPASLFPASTPAAVPQPFPQPLANLVQAEVTFTPATGEVFSVVYQWTAVPRYS